MAIFKYKDLIKVLFFKGHREQLNLLTHYIDGSQIYGSEIFKSLNLRQMKKGN